MSTYTKTIGRLDTVLDVILSVAGDFVADDKTALLDAAGLIHQVRNRLVGADHDEDRKRAAAAKAGRMKVTIEDVGVP